MMGIGPGGGKDGEERGGFLNFVVGLAHFCWCEFGPSCFTAL